VDERAESTISVLQSLGKSVVVLPKVEVNNLHSGALHCMYKEIPSSVEILIEKPSYLTHEVTDVDTQTCYIPLLFD
jgi:hypothetical protein